MGRIFGYADSTSHTQTAFFIITDFALILFLIQIYLLLLFFFNVHISMEVQHKVSVQQLYMGRKEQKQENNDDINDTLCYKL